MPYCISVTALILPQKLSRRVAMVMASSDPECLHQHRHLEAREADASQCALFAEVWERDDDAVNLSACFLKSAAQCCDSV